MFLKNFDFLSPNITLYFYNQKKHSSYLGGLLSIAMMIICFNIIFIFSFTKVYPSESSLLLYRNYGSNINLHFNKTGIYHYLWIFNEKILKDNNNINQNLIKLNDLKKGIIRIYMTYSNNYDFNSSNLKFKDHWVYDTCSNYIFEEDIVYDYSFSSCIKYYYNSMEKKYYSIYDNNNFKWPYMQNITDYINSKFGIFVEKCDNNSILNEILGECYTEGKINEYLYYFNSIFLSFINGKIENKNEKEPIKFDFQKIYDNLNNKNDIYAHDLTFVPFNYKQSKGIFSKKIEHNSFFFNDEKISKLYPINNNKLLIAYLFHTKKYINEFIKKNNNLLEFFNGVGSSIFLIYILFYGFNYIINERIQLRNFQLFLDDKDNDLIQRHINYEKIKTYSFKTNFYTHISNDLIKNDGYNSFKSNYLMKNDLTNISNLNNISNEENFNLKPDANNNYRIKINKINENYDEVADKTGFGQKSENIIVINNNSFMNNNTNNRFISNNSLEKYNSLKLVNKFNKFENLNGLYHKTYTYNKKTYESPSIFNINSVVKNNNLDFVKVKKNEKIITEKTDTKKNDSVEFNSRNKIIDTSSISLLNGTANHNKIQNILISSYNDSEKKESLTSQVINSNFFSKLNTKIQDSSNRVTKGKNTSFNNFHYHADLSKIEEKGENKDRKVNKLTFITFDKERRKSPNQPRVSHKSEKDIREHFKIHKEKIRKTGGFLKFPEYRPERHLSLFSKYSINNYNSAYHNDNNNYGNVSPTIRKNFNDQYKKTYPINQINPKRSKKRQSSELEIKSLKKKKLSSIKNLNEQEKNTRFIKIIQNNKITPKNICNYICLCKNKENSIYMLKNFRQKLLSEEYLYLLHINMFIFKQKFGSKSNLEQISLLEELYNYY